eukprot:scaffold151026_cov35-Tisochrysis_lutea.AAC.1
MLELPESELLVDRGLRVLDGEIARDWHPGHRSAADESAVGHAGGGTWQSAACEPTLGGEKATEARAGEADGVGAWDWRFSCDVLWRWTARRRSARSDEGARRRRDRGRSPRHRAEKRSHTS